MRSLLEASDLSLLERGLLSDPTDVGRWLVYFDRCLEAGLDVSALVPLVAGASRLDVAREPGFEIAVELKDPESRATVRIGLSRVADGQPMQISARFRRSRPPLDWLVSYPWSR